MLLLLHFAFKYYFWLPATDNTPRQLSLPPLSRGDFTLFEQALISDLEKHEFMNKGGRGSHRNFVHIKYPYVVVISGKAGADAKEYQEKAVKKAIKGVTK